MDPNSRKEIGHLQEPIIHDDDDDPTLHIQNAISSISRFRRRRRQPFQDHGTIRKDVFLASRNLLASISSDGTIPGALKLIVTALEAETLAKHFHVVMTGGAVSGSGKAGGVIRAGDTRDEKAGGETYRPNGGGTASDDLSRLLNNHDVVVIAPKRSLSETTSFRPPHATSSQDRRNCHPSNYSNIIGSEADSKSTTTTKMECDEYELNYKKDVTEQSLDVFLEEEREDEEKERQPNVRPKISSLDLLTEEGRDEEEEDQRTSSSSSSSTKMKSKVESSPSGSVRSVSPPLTLRVIHQVFDGVIVDLTVTTSDTETISTEVSTEDVKGAAVCGGGGITHRRLRSSEKNKTEKKGDIIIDILNEGEEKVKKKGCELTLALSEDEEDDEVRIDEELTREIGRKRKRRRQSRRKLYSSSSSSSCCSCCCWDDDQDDDDDNCVVSSSNDIQRDYSNGASGSGSGSGSGLSRRRRRCCDDEFCGGFKTQTYKRQIRRRRLNDDADVETSL